MFGVPQECDALPVVFGLRDPLLAPSARFKPNTAHLMIRTLGLKHACEARWRICP
jgi:hypothetical protein